MGYAFEVQPVWFKIKHKKKDYPWPYQGDKNRTITIFDDDVLTRSKDGTLMKHTGIGCFGIVIPEEDLVRQEDPAKLVML